MSRPFHVIVIGGGIGSLTLAQGLRKAGVSVAVYERDRTRTDRLQGYRIHINPTGGRALHDCLPPELYQAFVDTTGNRGAGYSFVTERLRALLHLGEDTIATSSDPLASHHSVSRITLRQVLLAGLDDVVHFDKHFVRYQRESDGRVTAHFDDGTAVTGDVLVAADGVRSLVRRQYLPHAELVDTGVVAIAGKTPLNDHTRAVLPPLLYEGPANVITPKGCGMFIAVQEFSRTPVSVPVGVGGNDAAADQHAGLLFDNTADYIMWAYAAPRSWYGVDADPAGMAPADLHELAGRLVDGWHPDLRRLVSEADSDTVSSFPIRSSVPIDPWPTTNITLLGDAIHSMTPMRGIGANTALRDASLLTSSLVAAARGERPLLDAIHDYEQQMIDYGFAAVRASMKAVEQFTAGPAMRIAFKTFLRVVGAVPPLKRKIFAGFGSD